MPTTLNRSNATILNTPEHLLGALEKQRVFLLKRLGSAMPCPNCGNNVSFIKAKGETIESFDATASHGDDCTCPYCKRGIKHVVPMVSTGGPGWQWQLIPVEITVYDTPPVTSKPV